MGKGYWGGLVCCDEKSQQACLSWVRAMVPESYGLPLKADVFTDEETDQTKAIRMLFRLPDGRLRMATRRNNKQGVVIAVSDASKAILKGFRDHHS